VAQNQPYLLALQAFTETDAFFERMFNNYDDLKPFAPAQKPNTDNV